MRINTPTENGGRILIVNCGEWFNVEHFADSDDPREVSGSVLMSYDLKPHARLYQKIVARTDNTHGQAVKAVRRHFLRAKEVQA